MRNTDIIFRKNPLFEQCPSCAKGNSLHRSRSRDWKEFLVKYGTYYKIYRCGQCGWRGYLSTITITKNSLKTFLFYLLIGLISAFIVMQILKRIS